MQPISGADKIELATVLGWKVVVSKSENHKVGDLIAYVEIDTQLPNIPMFEFLKDKKYRVRTIKLRKQISQGLIIPLKAIEQNFNIKISKLKEGDDITSLIGATKYDPEAEKERKLAEEAMAKNNSPIHKVLMKYKWYRKLYKQITIPKKGGFPKWIKKTDEERCLSGRTKIETNKGKIEIKDIVNSNKLNTYDLLNLFKLLFIVHKLLYCITF